MQSAKTTTTRVASGLLKLLIILNYACLLLFVVFGLGSFPFEADLVRILTDDGIADPAAQIGGMRMAMLIGIVAVLPAHFILTRLLRIVESVEFGAAFTTVNAARLRTIAWSLLAIQFLDLGFGWLSYRYDEVMEWSPSVTGWLAVLLLFVLAHVFNQGAAMREELDATV